MDEEEKHIFFLIFTSLYPVLNNINETCYVWSLQNSIHLNFFNIKIKIKKPQF